MFVFSFGGGGGRFCQCKFFCFSLDDTVSMEAELEFLRDQGETKLNAYFSVTPSSPSVFATILC